ncbi:MAG: hypothetical protein ACRC2S_29035 [Waterburya sp.]
MKLLHKLLGIGTLGLIVTLPLINQTPVLASFPQVTEIIAQAAQKPTVKLNLTAEKKSIVVTTGGKEKIEWSNLEDQAVVNPGDILRYTVSSANTGTNAAKNLTITQPIPNQMVYELKTAKSGNQAVVTYSIDNGKTFVAKPTIKIKTENGKTIEKPAPAETYTHIRWQFSSLPSAAGITAMYEVKVQ